MPHVAGLDLAQTFAAAFDGEAGAVDDAVDDRRVDAARQEVGREPEERTR